MKTIATLVFALLGAPLVLADTVTGRVVDQNGIAVPGVNIDAIRVSNGNDQDILNDGTTATGDFTSTIQAGIYDLYFYAPQPPQTTLVTLVLRNVAVSGTRNLGTLQMTAGISLRGRILNPAGAPVSQVELIVIDGPTKALIALGTRKTDAFGNFNIAVPNNALELQIDASAVPLQTLVSRTLSVTPVGNTNLGDLTLAQGFRLTGHLQRAVGGLAVSGVDLDIVDVATGQKLFLPDDSSNALGNFSVVLPTGTFDVEFCPPFSARLVGRVLKSRSVTGALDLGILTLETGFVLSGTIRTPAGLPAVGADVDVSNKSTGTKVHLCSDNSGATGNYAVVVPAGNLKVKFQPPGWNVGLGTDVHKNVLVSSDRLLDGALPICPTPVNYGVGLAGTGGVVPHLTVSGGIASADNPNFAFELQGGRGGAQAFLMLSANSHSSTGFGGTLLVSPDACCSVLLPVQLGGASGGAGAGSLRYELPYSMAFAAGFDVYAQFFVEDPGAVQGWSFSDALRLRVCR